MSSNEWEEHKLEDVLECLIDYRGKTPTKTATGIPLVTAKIVKNGFVQKPDEYIAESDYESWMTRGFPEIRDVLLTTEAPLGEVAQLNIKRVALAQRLVTLRGKKKILDNGFLKYFLRSDVGQARLKARETGTTVTGIKQSELRQIMIPLPRIETQRAIAATLSALDDKIELNNRINKTLEEMAQALFKRWFVDFEFPDENDQPYKSSGGEMEESELGMIPKGWKVGEISELCCVQIGGDWGEEFKFEDAIPVVCLRGTDLQKLKEFGFSIDAPIRWVKKSSATKRKITDKDILVGGSGLGPVGRSLYCARELEKLYEYPIIYSNFCKRITAINRDHAIYVEHIIENMHKNGEIKQYVNGTSIPNLDVQGLLKHKLCIPSSDMVEKYSKIKANYFCSVFAGESRTLSSLRDALLPKLMSGEIRVPIEEVATDV